MKFDSTDYLTEYYDVSFQKAIELGTRSNGRKPDLPASETCEAVSGMTMEDIWDLKERKTEEEVFEFYADQGAWSTFRQCVRHRELSGLHNGLWNFLKPLLKDGVHICEYGCGVAPFSYTLCNSIDSNKPINISLSDIDKCEHLIFGNWRLNKIKQEKSLDINIDLKPVKAGELPKYNKKLDIVIAFEVLEHVPSPLKTLANIMSQMNPGAVFVENFIAHPPDEDDDGPDLLSAAMERQDFYNILSYNFNLIGGQPIDQDPNGTRVWQIKG